MNHHNLYYWLEAEQPSAGQAPTSDPNAPGQIPDPAGQGQPAPQQQPDSQDPLAQQTGQEDDVTQDPQDIQAPEGEKKDFEQWRHDFFEMAIKADNEEMVNALNSVRDRNGLEASQRKFIEDNLQIFLYRRDASIAKASKEIRNLVKQELDKVNPGTTIMQHVMASLDAQPLLFQNIIKLAGTFGWKSDLHRKWLAALLGAVQTGGGSVEKDIVYCEKEFDMNFSTRFATQFGEINLGRWGLLQDDPKKYLKPDEQDSLAEGSPEEKQVLRRKIILRAVAEKFRKRAFLIHVVSTDGTIYALGWDMGNSLIDGYKDGKIVVRGQEDENKEVIIGDDGEIMPVIDYSLLFVKETGEVDDNGRPETEEVPFVKRKDSILYLNADLETIRTASASLSGCFFKEVAYNGNPAEILTLQRSVPGLNDIINRQVV